MDEENNVNPVNPEEGKVVVDSAENATTNVNEAENVPKETTEATETVEQSNETAQASNDSNGSDNGKKSNGTNKAMWVVLGLVALVLVVLVCAVIGNSFNSKSNKLLKMLFDDNMFASLESIFNMAEEDKNISSNLEIDIDKISEAMGEDSLNFGTIGLTQNSLIKDEGINVDVGLTLSSNEIATASLIASKEGLGVAVPGLFDEYIVIKNENLKDLAEKLGIDSGDIENSYNYMESNLTDTFKYTKTLKPYLKVIEKEASDYITTEKSNVTIKDTTLQTKATTLKLDEKATAYICRALLKKAINDKDFYEFVKEYATNVTVPEWEEWNNTIKEYADKFDELIKENNFTSPGAFTLTAHQVKGDTVAIVFETKEFEDIEDTLISLSSLTNKDEDYLELAVNYEDSISKLYLVNAKSKNKLDGNIGFSYMDNNVDFINYSIEKSDENGELKGLDSVDTFVLNDESKEAIYDKMDEIAENLDTYVETVMGKLPENVSNLLANIINSSDDDGYSDDKFELDVPQVEALPELKEKYGKISIGMKKDELLTALGTPDETKESGNSEYLYWYHSTLGEFYYVCAEVSKGLVTGKELEATSASFDGVQISKELGTTLEDLETALDNVKTDMTLKQVVNILGSNYLEIERYESGNYDVVWYDINENHVVLSFDNEGKLYYKEPILTSI